MERKGGEGGTRRGGLMVGSKRAPLLFEHCTSGVLRVYVYETGRHYSQSPFSRY
jgi:hypothetical protein